MSKTELKPCQNAKKRVGTYSEETSKKRIFDSSLWHFEHISLVRSPIDAIQDVQESQQTGLQLCCFEFHLKMDTRDLTHSLNHEGRHATPLVGLLG